VTVSLKVRKGDLVQILSGKDRGKQGRVIQASPADRQVIVENLNVAKRHTKAKPIKDSSRMGGQQIAPGGVIDKAVPLPVSKVMVVCPTCQRPTRIGTRLKDVKDKHVKVRVCRRADCGEEIDR
jgi:large subunit ribosomal protein L24